MPERLIPGMDSMALNPYPAGTAPIKAEYILPIPARARADDDAAESRSAHVSKLSRPTDGANGAGGEGEGEEGGTAGGKKGRKTKDKERKGANKGRRFKKAHDELNLCWRVAQGSACEFGSECRYTHDVPAYLAQKPRDLRFPHPSALSECPPFVLPALTSTSTSAPDSGAASIPAPTPTSSTASVDDDARARFPTVDFDAVCPVYEETGGCKHGLKCRFLGAHARPILVPAPVPLPSSASAHAGDVGAVEDGSVPGPSWALELLTDEDKKARMAVPASELNFASADVLKALRSKKYPKPITNAYLAELAAKADANIHEHAYEHDLESSSAASTGDPMSTPPPYTNGTTNEEKEKSQTPHTNGHAGITNGWKPPDATGGPTASADADTPDVALRSSEKRRLHWRDKTYLAPLTTVGNLPFRRLCVSLGADITCGEMGLATSFLSGSKEEWSLVRRHPSERTFGAQLAGSKPATLVAAAEALGRECVGGLDFVDVNCGCPIDLVFRTGSGSALLDTPGKLEKIVVGMNRALGDVPVTVKLRTGVKDGRNNAHKLMPRLLAAGTAAMTLHGRTRQQRYAKLADWDYIRQCVAAVRAKEEEEGLQPVPIFGGGDCYSAQDYWTQKEHAGVDGVMVARGALIKPWIFTEIKEHREWDISARERLELIRKYAEFGLHHFGSDTAGVNTTRRYLCEALSFQYRYVPLGILEHIPGRINDRPPAFRGRNELETLLASDDSRDWVRISEMFLGPAPETWIFTPKHRSNAYESQG